MENFQICLTTRPIRLFISFYLRERQRAMWPNVEIKRSPNFTISSLKSCHSSVYLKGVFFKGAHKVNEYLGNLSEKICHQNLSKIAQSGHTGKGDDYEHGGGGVIVYTDNVHNKLRQLKLTQSAFLKFKFLSISRWSCFTFNSRSAQFWQVILNIRSVFDTS